jgi:excisionase family DNA binding protein
MSTTLDRVFTLDAQLDRLLTIDEASRITSLSPSWWRRAIAHARVGSVKIGGAIRIRASEVARLIEAGNRPAIERSLREELDVAVDHTQTEKGL